MPRLCLLFGTLTVALLLGSWSLGDDTKSTADDKKQAEPKLKGQLPANWKKLGLSEDQVQKVYKVQTDYDTKVEALETQIKKLRQDEKADLLKVLTDAQKARLKEINEGK